MRLDYVVLSAPQRQESNGKSEVVEFFSWGCPHCYEFYPRLSRWLSTLPKDASFKRVPVALGHREWEALAKAYYALQVKGVNMNAGQAEQRAEDYRIPGVPTLAIAGKYTVGGYHAKMLATSDQLIAMERAASKTGR